MPIDRAALENAISASDGASQPDDQVEGLLTKLRMLEATGRYGGLLRDLIGANDKSNFLAYVLEATFAYQFEQAGLPLDYEVRQVATQDSSIDFGLKLSDEQAAYFELRVLQQDQATAQSIAEQLSATRAYVISQDGADEQQAVLRIQSTALSKVENDKGQPKKFFKVDEQTINIVVVCISDLLLGTVDVYDCLLVACGDPAVPEECRRNVLGLFQAVKPEYREEIRAVGARFEHIKATIHGILFLFRPRGSGVLDCTLQQVLVWNPALTTEARAKLVSECVSAAIQPFR